MYAWVDAASQNRSDGGSTQGIVVGLGSLGMLKGEVSKVSLVSWHSNKIDRVRRSPGAGEARTFFTWAEFLYGAVDTRNPDATVRKITGTVVSDSRNVFDKLQTEVLSMKGA